MSKTYNCPNAYIDWEGITCTKDETPCLNVRYCRLKGRQVLTEFAEDCPQRKEKKTDAKAGKKKQLSDPNNSGRV